MIDLVLGLIDQGTSRQPGHARSGYKISEVRFLGVTLRGKWLHHVNEAGDLSSPASMVLLNPGVLAWSPSPESNTQQFNRNHDMFSRFESSIPHSRSETL